MTEDEYSDAQVVQLYADQTGQPTREVAERFGVVDPDQGDFSRGFSAGVDSLKATGSGVVGLAGDALGIDSVRDAGIRGYERNMAETAINARETDTVEGLDSIGDVADFVQYYSGYGIPQAASAVVSGGLGGLAGKQVVKQGVKKKLDDGLRDQAQDLLKKGQQRGSLAGVGVQGVGSELGATYGQAVEEAQARGESIDDINLGRVATYGTAAGLLETAGDVATLGLARLGPAKDLIAATQKSRTARAVTRGTGAAGVEAVTEGLQTGLEDLGAGRSMEDARFFDPTAMAAGAIGGGQLGVLGGVLSPSPDSSATEANDIQQRAQVQLEMDLGDPNGEAVTQQVQQRQAEKQAEMDRVETQRQDDLRREVAQNFTEGDFKKQLEAGKKERAAKLELDVDNPSTEIGQTFLNTVKEERLLSPEKIQKRKKEFVKQTLEETEPEIDFDAAYEAALDEQIANRGQASFDFDGTTSQPQPQEAEAPAPAATAAVDPLTIPVRQRKDAIKQTEALVEDGSLPPNWAEQNDDLNGAVNGQKFNIKKYKAALDKVLNPVEETAAVPTPANTLPDTTGENASAQLIDDILVTGIGGKPLTKGQQSVATELFKAFNTNEESKFLDSKGKLSPTLVAEAAGLKSKQAAKSVIDALKTKLAEAENKTVDEKRAELKRTGITSSEEFDQNAPEQVFDQADLGDGSGTLASVGQGTNDGRTDEEIEFANQQADEPNAIADQRAEEANQRRANVDAEIKELLPQVDAAKAANLWSQVAPPTAPKIKQLSKYDVRELLLAVLQYQASKGADIGGLEQDFKEISDRYSVADGEIDGQGNEVPAISGPATDQENTADPDQSGEGGSGTQSDGEKNTSDPSQDATGDEDVGENFTAGENKTNVTVEKKIPRKLNRPRFGLPPSFRAAQTATRDTFEGIIKQLTGKKSNFRVRYFDTINDFIAARITTDEVENAEIRSANPFGFVRKDKNEEPIAYFILENIPKGGERAAFMHEVGSHVGIDNLIPEEDRILLEAQITRWALKNDNSQESIIAKRALQAVGEAQLAVPNMTDEEVTSETIAYFLQEATLAGVEPTVSNPVGRFVRDLYARFKRALRTLGFDIKNLTPQDVVDLAWGASRISLRARKHGTAADFRRFNHDYMSSGEGAQVFGWGTYLAERFSIARWYLRMDEARKRGPFQGEFSAPRFNLNEMPITLRRIVTNPTGLGGFAAKQYVDRMVAKRTNNPADIDIRLKKSFSGHKLGSQAHIDEAEVLVSYDTPGARRSFTFDQLTDITPKLQFEIDRVKLALIDELIEAREMGVEGNLMTVDTTVNDDELLPWMEEISSAPDVYNNLVEMFENLNVMAVLDTMRLVGVRNVYLDNDISFGPRVRDIRRSYFRQQIDYENAPLAGGDEDVMSVVREALDTATGQDVYMAMRRMEIDQPYLFVNALKEFQGEGSPLFIRRNDIQAEETVSRLMDDYGVKGVIFPDNASRRASSPTGIANNNVIFNDKNLIVVSRSPGKRVSDETSTVGEIKYGLNGAWVGHNFGAPAKNAFDTASEIMKFGARSTSFLHDLIRKHGDKMPAIKRWYEGVLKAEAIRSEIRLGFEDIAVRARDLKDDRLNAINDFLGKSTFDQKWGYDPKEYHPELFEKKQVKVDSQFAYLFNRLSDDEKQLVADVFAHGEKMRKRKEEIAKQLGVAGKFFTDASLEGPYAPLKRFGNYVAEMKSQRLINAENLLSEKNTKENRKLVDDLKSDPEHYIIRFFDTPGSAQQFVDANSSRFAAFAATEKTPDVEMDRVTNPQVYEKVLGALNAGSNAQFDAKAKNAFADMVKNLYFQSLDERSARLSGSRRLNRAGYDENMMKSFLSHARAEASLIAQMETGAEVNTALAEAAKEVKGDNNVRDKERQSVYIMVVRHYRDGLIQQEGPVQAVMDRLAAANSVYMLTSSIGYHLTNATQPAMVTVPRIAGDFNDYSGAWSALFKGYKVAMGATSMSRNMQTKIDLDKVPQQYRKLLENLQLRQLLDVGMEEDLAEFDRFQTGFEFIDKGTGVLGKITHKLYQVARYVEAQNRISAAVAAYDVAQSNTQRLSDLKMNAQEYATAVVEDTQGNFSRLDAPLLLKSLPKLTVQYRKYQLLMAWHYSKAFKQTFMNPTINPFAESTEAQKLEFAVGGRILGYSLAHAALGAGATGIPLLSTAFWLTTFLGDEDEPDDLERYIKREIDDGVFGTALSRGIFSTVGIDLSTKLNQSKIFHPLPYVDYQLGESGAKDIFFNALAGPVGTTGVNFFRAGEYAKQGDVFKGMEYAVPKGIRSAMESYRLATDGYTMRNGDVVVDPREIDAFSLLVNAMGIPSTEIQEIKWTRGQQYELEQYFSKESGKIRKAYIKANKARDRQGMKNLREEWRELQDAKDRVRPFFNDTRGVLNRQSVSDLLRAPREQKKREAKGRSKLSDS